MPSWGPLTGSPPLDAAPVDASDPPPTRAHVIVYPEDCSDPEVRAWCEVCGASAYIIKRDHGGSGVDWLRGTQCRGELYGKQKIKADPEGKCQTLAERAAAQRARNAQRQRERRAAGTCLNKPEHRRKQAENARAKRAAKRAADGKPPLQRNSGAASKAGPTMARAPQGTRSASTCTTGAAGSGSSDPPSRGGGTLL